MPADPAYGFLGNPGATVYVLPETENPDLLFAGLATEEVEPGEFAGDSVDIRFRQVIGPDGFSLFATDPVGAPHTAPAEPDPAFMPTPTLSDDAFVTDVESMYGPLSDEVRDSPTLR